MSSLDRSLRARLADLDRRHLRRTLRELQPLDGTRAVLGPDSRPLLNFSSNDYLALATHPEVLRAATDATRHWGAGAGASRLICGSLGLHHDLERALADLKGTAAALVFSTGFAAALGTLPALVGPGDFVLIDRLAHACLVDAARQSGARLRVFRHNDVTDLARLGDWVTAERAKTPARPSDPGPGHVLIVTESVFSMDGDLAPLREIVALRDRLDAWLMVDEAHATGVLGPQGRGAIEAQQLAGRVDIVMGTLGKALGAAGGFIAGSAILIDHLVNRARSFIFSTAPPPAAMGAALAALGVVTSAEGADRRDRLSQRLQQLHTGLVQLGWTLPVPASAIVPLRIGAEEDSLRLATALREEGLLIPAIRHPTVARGQARLRLTLSAAHTPADVDQLLAALRRSLDRTGIRPPAAP